jgi:hypothetical protein
MATPGTYNLTLQRRADHSFDVNLKDSNNANENLTGKTILSQIWNESRTTKLADATITVTDATGANAQIPQKVIIVTGTNAFANASLMLNKISSVLSILSFIISVTTIAAGYAGYRYITSPQFEAMMMEKVMEGVSKILPNQIEKKMPKVTGPMLPL